MNLRRLDFSRLAHENLNRCGTVPQGGSRRPFLPVDLPFCWRREGAVLLKQGVVHSLSCLPSDARSVACSFGVMRERGRI
jgi:hypothetical protein